MDAQHDTRRGDLQQLEDARRLTRRGVLERLTDPYLTEHDRWVLEQFARFLDGRAPGPDPRAVPVRPREPLYSRARRANL